MAARSIAAFWVIAFLLVIVPGPDWAFTVSAGLRGRSVLPAVGGIVLGYAAMTVVVAAGVGALVARTPAFLSALTVAGGLYLMWHGTTTVAKPSAPGTTAAVPGNTAAPARTGPGHARAGHRRQRPEPQRPAAFPRAAPSVHQPALELAAGGPARFPRPGLHVHLRGLLLLPGVFRAEDPARPAGRRACRHPVVGSRDDHYWGLAPRRSPHRLTAAAVGGRGRSLPGSLDGAVGSSAVAGAAPAPVNWFPPPRHPRIPGPAGRSARDRATAVP